MKRWKKSDMYIFGEDIADKKGEYLLLPRDYQLNSAMTGFLIHLLQKQV
jgi:hypothetical protein